MGYHPPFFGRHVRFSQPTCMYRYKWTSVPSRPRLPEEGSRVHMFIHCTGMFIIIIYPASVKSSQVVGLRDRVAIIRLSGPCFKNTILVEKYSRKSASNAFITGYRIIKRSGHLDIDGFETKVVEILKSDAWQYGVVGKLRRSAFGTIRTIENTFENYEEIGVKGK